MKTENPGPASHLQCTMVGATVALFSLKSRTLSTNSTNSTESEGVPWSGQDRYCIWKEKSNKNDFSLLESSTDL